MNQRIYAKRAVLNSDLTIRVGTGSVFRDLPVDLKRGLSVEVIERLPLASLPSNTVRARVRLTKNFLADCTLPLSALDFVEDEPTPLSDDVALK